MLYGIIIAFTSFAAYAVSDACIKFLDGTLPAYEVACIGAFFGLFAIPFIKTSNDDWMDMFRTTNRKLWLLRAVSATVGVVGSVTAFTFLSMAEAFALIFLMPAFVTILSAVFLKEKSGWKRWTAVLIGFVGVLVVLRPGFRELSIGHFGALFAGLGGAIGIVIMRRMGSNEKRVSLYNASMIGPILICGLLMIPGFQAPTALQWLYLAGYGLLAALGGVLLIIAAQHAPASVVALPQYSQMIWAILFGYFIFNDHVDTPMLIGIVLIVISGLFTFLREQQRGIDKPPTMVTTMAEPSIMDDTQENHIS
ncbi:DMT family transporter [Daeguia caeni]|uniref:DMT family transporter n=1 Tax=Daeguia caeni TaxID=439612 RepID=A0ABV9H4X1_9HYPH